MAARINPPTLCPSRAARLREMVQAGLRPAEIARREGIARSTMTEVLQRYGFRRGAQYRQRVIA